MKRQSKLTPREEQALSEQVSQKHAAHEFSSVEEMLRHDALHTPVPPRIAHRLQQSVSGMTPPTASWWRRLLGGS